MAYRLDEHHTLKVMECEAGRYLVTFCEDGKVLGKPEVYTAEALEFDYDIVL